jgi:G3E family GTPase
MNDDTAQFIPVTVFTGFLGSGPGKSSFLNRIPTLPG